MYRGACNEKHSTTETTCLFAPTTTATTQKHSQSRCEAKFRIDKKKKKFIPTQNTENRNEKEREKTLWGKKTGLSSPGSCSRVASFRLENSRSTTMAPSSFFSNKPPPPSCFLSLAIDISLSASSGLGLGLGGVLPAQLWIRPCRYGEKNLFLCECRRVLEASKDVL